MLLINETNNIDSSNDIDLNYKYNLHIYVPIAWSIIVLVGVIGNGLVLYILLKRKLLKDSCTNCYIANVAIADLSFTLIVVPITMSAYIYKDWIFGEFMCHFINLLIFSSLQSTCLTLTAMTIDRYLAILYPFKSINFRTSKVAVMITICIWIASFVLCIPYFMYYQLIIESDDVEYDFMEPRATNVTLTSHEASTTRHCIAKFPSKKWEQLIAIYTVIMSYVLPLTTILFCYIRMIIKFVKKSSDNMWNTPGLQSSVSYSTNNRSTLIGNTSNGSPKSFNQVKLPHERQTKLRTNNLSVYQPVNLQNTKNSFTVRRQKKRKILILIASVCITFALLWLPAHVIQLWRVVFHNSFPYTDSMYIIKIIAHTLSYANSCVNPVIYAFMGTKFRNYFYLEFQGIFTWFGCKRESIKRNEFINNRRNIHLKELDPSKNFA
jgi:KISS1 receptor